RVSQPSAERIRPMRTAPAVAAICAAALFATMTVAQDMTPEERATEARQGLMKLIVWEAGPLFAMAKGDISYAAETATARAENLATLAQYAGQTLFLPGSSTEDLGEEATLALPAIWEDEEAFHQGFADLREQSAIVATEAGEGHDALLAAVGKMGR